MAVPIPNSVSSAEASSRKKRAVIKRENHEPVVVSACMQISLGVYCVVLGCRGDYALPTEIVIMKAFQLLSSLVRRPGTRSVGSFG